MFDGFTNPGLLAGLALASIPLLIHIFNRQRHNPVRWAAMRFVIAAQKRTRRRVQLENWLLLLLRVAAVLLLALAISRPFVGSDGALSALTETRRDVVLVLDASASTGYREDVETIFDRIRERASEVLREFDGVRGDRARLVLAADTPRLLSWTDPRKAAMIVESLERPEDAGLDLAAALAEVLRFAEEDAAGSGQSALEVRLLTDFQERSFLGDDGRPVQLDETLDALDALGVRVLVEDLGPAPLVPPNLSIDEIEILGPVVGAGTPVEVRVRIANHSEDVKHGVRVALELDGERRPTQIVDLPARGSGEAVFPVIFRTPGDHALRARLEGDRLAADDSRTFIARVPDATKVLVVNGSPAVDIDRDATGYLMAVLEPATGDDLGIGSSAAPFTPREITTAGLENEEVDIAEYSVIWLADVASLSDRVVTRLEEHISAGNSLIVSLGPRPQIEAYERNLHRADGTGLLPLALGPVISVASRRENYYRASEFDALHPALRFFDDERWRPLFSEMPVYDFVSTTIDDTARVLARLDDLDRSPLLVERPYDRGRVFVWTTTISPQWTLLPASPRSLVPFVHELVRAAASTTEKAWNLAPRESFTAVLDSFPRRIELIGPDGEGRRAIEGEPQELPGGRWRLPVVESDLLARAGLYRLECEGADDVLAAVRIDAAEGDLARLTPEALDAIHRALAPYDPTSEGAEDTGGIGQKGELWRGLALAALIALIGESLWGAWIGYRRRIA